MNKEEEEAPVQDSHVRQNRLAQERSNVWRMPADGRLKKNARSNAQIAMKKPSFEAAYIS